jgi:hypothetical protein
MESLSCYVELSLLLGCGLLLIEEEYDEYLIRYSSSLQAG